MFMSQIPKVIRSKDVALHEIKPGVARKRLITNKMGGARNLIFSMSFIDPNETPHSWHTHSGPFFDGERQNEYPKDFEEYYFVLKGKCTVFWRIDKKEMQEQAAEGDLLFFPVGVVEHQVVNTGKKTLIMAVIMAPPFT
jgi:mannose-6-phosphate isomerase-like protein (cupin superfamily)